MRGVGLVSLLGIMGCATSLTPRVRIIHDDARDVTCWLVPQVGIACVPDRFIEGPEPNFIDKNAVILI